LVTQNGAAKRSLPTARDVTFEGTQVVFVTAFFQFSAVGHRIVVYSRAFSPRIMLIGVIIPDVAWLSRTIFPMSVPVV